MAATTAQNFGVTYASSTDSFVFTFASGVPTPKRVLRPNFSYLALAPNIPDGVSFFSRVSSENQRGDGITVTWSNCTSPVASSDVDLYTKILALYTGGGGGGAVASVTVSAPITDTGTATDPIIGHATTGTAGTYAYPQSVTTDATGHVSAISAGAQPVASVSVVAPITDTGSAANPILGHAATGTAGTYAYPSSVVTNATGHVSAITAGAQPVGSVSVTTPIINNGTALDPVIAHAAVGTANTYAYPVSITTTTQGHVSAVTAGTQPVQSVTAGTNVTVTGTATNPIINATASGGITTINANTPIVANTVGSTTTLDHAVSGVTAQSLVRRTVFASWNANGHLTAGFPFNDADWTIRYNAWNVAVKTGLLSGVGWLFKPPAMTVDSQLEYDSVNARFTKVRNWGASDNKYEVTGMFQFSWFATAAPETGAVNINLYSSGGSPQYLQSTFPAPTIDTHIMVLPFAFIVDWPNPGDFFFIELIQVNSNLDTMDVTGAQLRIRSLTI